MVVAHYPANKFDTNTPLCNENHMAQSKSGMATIYSGKFSRGSIFADDRYLQFRSSNSCRRMHSCPLCTVQLSLFRGFNFHG